MCVCIYKYSEARSFGRWGLQSERPSPKLDPSEITSRCMCGRVLASRVTA